jgi:hypothetical protein
VKDLLFQQLVIDIQPMYQINDFTDGSCGLFSSALIVTSGSESSSTRQTLEFSGQAFRTSLLLKSAKPEASSTLVRQYRKTLLCLSE